MSLAGNLASGGQLREAIEVYKTLMADFPEEQAFFQYAALPIPTSANTTWR
jgi:hypothetical protein